LRVLLTDTRPCETHGSSDVPGTISYLGCASLHPQAHSSLTNRGSNEIMTRNNTISVSISEKQRLDSVAEDAFGTVEVPYGATVSMLIKAYQNGGVDR